MRKFWFGISASRHFMVGAVLSLAFLSPAAADDGAGKWVPASGWKNTQWVVNTKTGEMRACILYSSDDSQLDCRTELKPDSAASGEPAKEPLDTSGLTPLELDKPAKD